MRKQNNFMDTQAPQNTGESPWSTVKRTIKPLKNNKIHKVSEILKSAQKHKKQTDIPSDNKDTHSLSQTEFEKILRRGIDRPLLDTVHMGNSPQDLIIGDTSRINKSHSRRLKSGAIPIDSILDLHGCTQQQAHQKMQAFLSRALLCKYRKVKIITGKGKGILQNALPEWINNSEFKPHILAIAVARPEHGGTGAYYILLKK